ncbi:cytokine receptor like factor 2 [Phyllostomus discolor]|uniref:Cytokine receptor-like factor 2 n=1 Tax=Phyllostomus discolor TaxID=89673 RepID=A0A6J2L1P4_9CHIR|nr:cytokine receptor-like factor 2 [Phyllostomus discolor]KAF6090239.1 cytokine receptor like factor 2 [Phyllostomus discolor]
MRAAPGPWAAAATAVFLLGDFFFFFFAAGDTATGEALPIHIINFNFETVQVTWNASGPTGTNFTFHYRFRGDNCSQCPSYLLQQGLPVGCVLKAKGDLMMDFSIGNGTHTVLSRSEWISSFLKPSSPRDLQFHWREEATTVTCPDLPYRGLRYEVQHKSVFDQEWQSTEEDTCNVTIRALDADRCYSFRARVTTKESSYGPHTYPSDWSEVAHRQRGEPRASCQKTPFSSKFVLVYGTVAALIVVLLPLSVWKLHRVKKLLVPRVPDPKVTFPGLFESHQGNFQEWIKDTQNIAVLNKTGEDREHESLLEGPLVVQRPAAKAEAPAASTTGPSHPQAAHKEAAGDPDALPCPPAPGKDRISLGGFTFVVNDNAYVTL